MVKEAFGSCTAASRFVFSTTGSDISVDTAMEAWLPNGGEALIKSSDYTKIGIAVLKPTTANPPVNECVVVFLVKP